MHHYLEFIQEWIGIGFVVPLLYALLLFGPITLFVWSGGRREALNSIGMFVAACMLIAYFFFCLGTGAYLGKFHGFGGWGLVLGLLVFGGSVCASVHLGRLARR